jgi:SAM-dependent methyltransferase
MPEAYVGQEQTGERLAHRRGIEDPGPEPWLELPAYLEAIEREPRGPAGAGQRGRSLSGEAAIAVAPLAKERIETADEPSVEQAAEAEPEAARLGNPTYVWRSGQDRRVALIERYAELRGKRVLDLGCGVGEYVRAFSRRGASSMGCDIASKRLGEARERDQGGTSTFLAAAAERLPFADGSFDVVVLNEVIEHVQDDGATLREAGRVLAPGGICVVFAPNRLYPFETHGIYLRRRYIFGNIPLVNWLPRPLRNRLVPHARVYGSRDWRRLMAGTGLSMVEHTYVYPGFDNIEYRSRTIARFLRGFCYWAEGNALRRFGLSHLVVYQRAAARRKSATPESVEQERVAATY